MSKQEYTGYKHTDCQKNMLKESMNATVRICHGLSRSAGWWFDSANANDYLAAVQSSMLSGKVTIHRRFGKALVAEKISLVHGEVSEALEGFRKNIRDEHLPLRMSVEVELADAVIRICDLAGALGLDLGGAIADKLEYNAQRADHKPESRNAEGGKAF